MGKKEKTEVKSNEKEIKMLLRELNEEKDSTTGKARAIRRRLRTLGYFLSKGKKSESDDEDDEPKKKKKVVKEEPKKKKKVKKVEVEEEDEIEEDEEETEDEE